MAGDLVGGVGGVAGGSGVGDWTAGPVLDRGLWTPKVVVRGSPEAQEARERLREARRVQWGEGVLKGAFPGELVDGQPRGDVGAEWYALAAELAEFRKAGICGVGIGGSGIADSSSGAVGFGGVGNGDRGNTGVESGGVGNSGGAGSSGVGIVDSGNSGGGIGGVSSAGVGVGGAESSGAGDSGCGFCSVDGEWELWMLEEVVSKIERMTIEVSEIIHRKPLGKILIRKDGWLENSPFFIRLMFGNSKNEFFDSRGNPSRELCVLHNLSNVIWVATRVLTNVGMQSVFMQFDNWLIYARQLLLVEYGGI